MNGINETVHPLAEEIAATAKSIEVDDAIEIAEKIDICSLDAIAQSADVVGDASRVVGRVPIEVRFCILYTIRGWALRLAAVNGNDSPPREATGRPWENAYDCAEAASPLITEGVFATAKNGGQGPGESGEQLKRRQGLGDTRRPKRRPCAWREWTFCLMHAVRGYVPYA